MGVSLFLCFSGFSAANVSQPNRRSLDSSDKRQQAAYVVGVRECGLAMMGEERWVGEVVFGIFDHLISRDSRFRLEIRGAAAFVHWYRTQRAEWSLWWSKEGESRLLAQQEDGLGGSTAQRKGARLDCQRLANDCGWDSALKFSGGQFWRVCVVLGRRSKT
jgi:hypothetical protein